MHERKEKQKKTVLHTTKLELDQHVAVSGDPEVVAFLVALVKLLL